MIGKNCFTTNKADLSLYIPTFGIKSIVSCDITLTNLGSQCSQAAFEAMFNFKQANSLAVW